MLAADTLQITVENLADDGGLAGTPFWVAVHDGGFNLGDQGSGAAAFDGLEAIAEEGDVSGIVARFASESRGNDGVITAPDGFAGAPVFEAGEAVTQDLVVDDTLDAQYFSFASMVIPSNDAFIANLNPMAYRLYDAAGDFLGPRTIVVYGSQVYDAGTEVNDPVGGAAFAAAGGTAVDENGVITRHSGLDGFVGATLATGENLAKAFGENTPIARITIAQAAQPSIPIDNGVPLAALDAATLNQRADYHEISVVYSDPSGVDLNSIRPENLRVTTPLLTQLDVVSVSTDAAVGSVPREVTATYRVAPTSGAFTSLDNGTYSIALRGNQVNDSFAQAAVEQLLGEFSVDIPVRLNITYENLADSGGLSQTPLWIAAHEGNFQVAQAGRTASEFVGLEGLAEEGDVSGIVGRFATESSGVDAVILAPDGFAGAPVFEPAESVTQTLDITDPLVQRYFSYASMVIPSNDAFIANLNPRSIRLFNRFGEFAGARSITIYGRDIWDAGTEVNAFNGGAAFSTEGGTSADENGVIRRHEGLDDFLGTGLPTGDSLDAAFSEMTPIGRITISLADIPTDPIDQTAPRAVLDASTASDPGQDSHEIRVTYSDASGIDVSSIDLNDVQVMNGLGASLRVASVSTDAPAGQTPNTVTAVYQIVPENGAPLSTFDNGLYFVNLVDGEVGDSLGNEVAADSLGNFEVMLPIALEFTIENLSVEGGLAETPFWIAVHEGNFQVAAANGLASDFGGLEAIVEEGDASGLASRFSIESGGVDGLVLAPGGFAGAPIFEPGEVAKQTLEVFDTNENRFFSFASMVIPSNDAFLANFNPRAYELFDEQGFFLGQRTITLFGRDIWDAGTEVNSATGGAAFSALGGTDVDENGVIRRHDGLDEFIGTPLPTGEDLTSAFDAATPIARITIGLAGASGLPIDRQGPSATAGRATVADAGTSTQEIQVTFSDPSGVDPTSIDVDDIRVVGPLGRELRVIDAVADVVQGTAPQTVTVTYTVTTPDGPFTARDNGSYDVTLIDGQVTDTLGIDSEVEIIGELTVDVGVRLEVEVELLTEANGLHQTPFWVGFHNGGFEVARGGLGASEFGGLELIAETGDASELVNRFAAESSGTDTVITAPGGFAGAPIFEPGEISSQIIEVEDTFTNRYFSFASMTIPSNDAFVANRNSRQYQLFDSLGNFQGARQITIYGRDILDSGSEVNDPAGGAAFSTGGGDGVDEGGVIRRHEGLDEFVATGLPTGEALASAFGSLTPIATITISLVDPEAEFCSGVLGACSARSVSLQNTQLSADVNRDGDVSPLDALLVINFLGRFGNTATIADEAQATGLDLDVGGDFQVSSMDALIVINEIARLESSTAGEGELTNRFDEAIAQITRSDVAVEDSEEDELFGLLF